MGRCVGRGVIVRASSRFSNCSYDILESPRSKLAIKAALLIRGEVTAGQTPDSKAKSPQSFLREIDLPMFKRIFVAAAHQNGN